MSAPEVVAWLGSAEGRLRGAAAVLSGLLAAQAFPATDLGFLAWVALVPLLAALEGCGPLRGAVLGGLQGLAFFSWLIYWIPAVVANFGGLPWLVALAAGALLVATCAFFHGLFGAVQGWLGRRGAGLALVAAPASWVLLAEWCRLWPMGGFPWGYLGYTQHRALPLLQLASIGGVFGLTFLVVVVNVAIFVALDLPRQRRSPAVRVMAAGTGGLLLLAAWMWGSGALAAGDEPSGSRIRVAAVQGNVLQDEKWQESNRQAILDRHLAMSETAAAAGARLVVWPESSTPEMLESSEALRSRLSHIARRRSTALVVGSVHRRAAGGYTNAGFLIGPSGEVVDRYDKVRLVPFGETVPFRSVLPFIEPLVQAVGEFVPGQRLEPLAAGVDFSGEGPTPFAMVICYEVTFADLVAAQVIRGATFLVTITNDAWFGRSSAAAQHFAMAAFRAAETRRWLVRAANTGISGLVSPTGRVLSRSPIFEQHLIQGEVEARDGLTLAVRYPWGVSWACVIILAAVAGLAVARHSVA